MDRGHKARKNPSDNADLGLQAVGPALRIMQLNVEGLSAAKTVFARNRDTAVPAEGNGNLQTLICVLVARPRRCLTLSNPAP